MSGRAHIACQNCATAKTGCDKRVPCSRCAEKGLTCEARYARRTIKAALRAAQYASTHHQHTPQLGESLQLSHRHDPEHNGLSPMSHGNSPLTQTMGSRVFDERAHYSSLGSSMTSLIMSPIPHGVDETDDFMPLSGNLALFDPNYPDMLTWTDLPADLNLYTADLADISVDVPPSSFGYHINSPSATDPSTYSSSSSRRSTHTIDTHMADMELSIKSTETYQKTDDSDPTTASDASWPLARCNPPIFSGACPRTAIYRLQNLLRLKDEVSWSCLETLLDLEVITAAPQIAVVPIVASTRDRLLAITQSFLHKALEIHRRGILSLSSQHDPRSQVLNFIVLPPSEILEYFLRVGFRSTEGYFSLTAGASTDPNTTSPDDRASTLLVLLSVAQGASMAPNTVAHDLAAGLAETCRLSLFDMIEKDVVLSAHPALLQCALSFTLVGAWSGDKWLMDIAMGQRGMYLAVC